MMHPLYAWFLRLGHHLARNGLQQKLCPEPQQHILCPKFDAIGNTRMIVTENQSLCGLLGCPRLDRDFLRLTSERDLLCRWYAKYRRNRNRSQYLLKQGVIATTSPHQSLFLLKKFTSRLLNFSRAGIWKEIIDHLIFSWLPLIATTSTLSFPLEPSEVILRVFHFGRMSGKCHWKGF